MLFAMCFWILVVLVLVIGTVFLSRFLHQREAAQAARRAAMLTPRIAQDPQRGRPRPWIIANPSKHASTEDYEHFKEQVNATAAELGIPHVHWLDTSVEDPGTGQAIRALKLGASVVIAAGGDGTVRAVAAGLAGSAVRMGIIPVGTGNLLARNLALPIDDVPAAVRVALGPDHRMLDIGWVRVDEVEDEAELPPEGRLVLQAREREGLDNQGTEGDEGATSRRTQPEDLPQPDEYSFVVISGIGFDGETMAHTDADLKKKVGWLAYVVSGISSMTSDQMHVRLTMQSPHESHPDWYSHPDVLPPNTDTSASVSTISGDEDEATTELTARSVMFANCGELPFITLAPDAQLDDGLIDVIAVDIEAGLLGWADLSRKLVSQGMGLKAENDGFSTGKIAFRQARLASVSVDEPQVVQVDGDAIGTARTVSARIQGHALDIAVPAP
ncbi:diacylglycerol kinase family protein [Schaalia sp. ZJ1691]|uniref:diacylglycerol/lipid kinase family protein n=1 Tax=Schaalia sp. ZJ1691 TaxID=2709404 RepID=UPI001F156894|nr:diacylglycerol kinase family protein [Schaalia sp. ZJ1691]